MSKRRQNARPCPTATKQSYGSEGDALAALAEIRAGRGDRPEREKMPVRAYRCECARWHVTSRPGEGQPITLPPEARAMAAIHAAAGRRG